MDDGTDIRASMGAFAHGCMDINEKGYKASTDFSMDVLSMSEIAMDGKIHAYRGYWKHASISETTDIGAMRVFLFPHHCTSPWLVHLWEMRDSTGHMSVSLLARVLPRRKHVQSIIIYT